MNLQLHDKKENRKLLINYYWIFVVYRPLQRRAHRGIRDKFVLHLQFTYETLFIQFSTRQSELHVVDIVGNSMDWYPRNCVLAQLCASRKILQQQTIVPERLQRFERIYSRAQFGDIDKRRNRKARFTYEQFTNAFTLAFTTDVWNLVQGIKTGRFN